jgi:hypothetical protein
MTSILTPEEVENVWAGASDPRNEDMSIHDFAVSLETAILAKLAARSGELPRVDFYVSVAVPEDTPVFTADQLRSHTAAMAARVEVLERAQAELRALVADDAWAMSFQTMGQYRSALLEAARAALFPAKP